MAEALLVALILGIFAPQLIRFYMDDPTIVQLGAQALRFQMAGRMFQAAVMVSTCICQSLGNARISLILSLVRQGVVYISVLFICSTLFGFSGTVAAQSVADLIMSIIAVSLVGSSLIREMKKMQD